MEKHRNSGKCLACAEIFDRYSGVHSWLRGWFEQFQSRHPEAHISCAGRGRLDQEAAFVRRASKARWKESAHNYNAAIDLFEMGGGSIGDIYERSWFDRVLAPEIPAWLDWYGAPGAPFSELPHVEVRGWRPMVAKGEIHLVE